MNPSVELAKQYLVANKLQHFEPVITEIILNHHKLTVYKPDWLVESFRRADLIDLSMGLFKFGIAPNQISQLNKKYPTLRFHRFILSQFMQNILKHPLNPLPIVKW